MHYCYITLVRAATSQVKRKNDVFKSIGRNDPNYTVRRQEIHIQEELEKVDMVKNVNAQYYKNFFMDFVGDGINP